MNSNFLKKSLAFLLTAMMVFSVMPVFSFAAENTGDDQIALIDENSSRALSDTKIGVSTKSTQGNFNVTTSGKTITVNTSYKLPNRGKGTLVIKNNKSNAVVLSFSYTLSGSTASLKGAISGSSGVYTNVLNAGASISIDLDSGNAGNLFNSATLVINNLSAKEIIAGAANVNVEYNSAYGSVTGAGENVGTAGKNVTVTATAASGSKFLGWTDVNGMVLSKSASYTFIATGNDTLMALFSNPNGEAYFEAGNYLSADINKAAVGGSLIVLVADGILGAGNYIIPAGSTLLIPKDTKNTINTTVPDRIDKAENPTHIAPTAFRTLKMAEGAKITVNGALNVAGTQYAGGTAQVMGGVYGPVGFIRMEEGSKITVNGGAYLYAWGYVIGSGDIEVLKNGTVYESFQTTDWRGGTATSALATDENNHVFPLTQYYVQNIEVAMKLNAGAFEKGYSCTTVTLAGVQGAEVPFIGTGSDNLFTIESGYVIKDYDESADRQTYKLYGNLSMKLIKVSMNAGVLGAKITLDSSKYVLPLTNNLTIEAVSGTITITQDLCFLPGAEIIIREGATCNLADGKSVYVYDLSEWGGFVGPGNATFIPLPFAPGRTYNRTALSDAKIQIDGTVNASSGFLYTTKSGAIVTSTGTGKVYMKNGTATQTYQLNQIDTDTTNVAIPVVPAKLQNADGTTTNPTKEINPKYGTAYTYTDGVWVAKCRNNSCEATGKTSCKDPLPCKYCSQLMVPDHTWDAGTVTIPAECEKEGEKTFNCTICTDGTKTEKIAALGHKAVTDKAVAATCTKTGLTEGSHCSVCNVVIKAQEEVPATGHTTVTDKAVNATCANEGKTEGSHCSACGEIFVAQETIPALPHTPATDKAVAPTCTEKGKTEGSHCSVCNAVIKAQEEIPATGHKPVTDKAVAATCTEDGKTEGSHCSVCNLVLVEQVTLAKKGHTAVTDKAVAATCTEKGLTEGSHCSVCNAVIKAQEEIPAAGHKEATDKAVAATCTADGLTEGTHCSVCNTVIKAQEKVPATGHKLTWTETKAPTAFAEGVSTGKCASCDYTETKAIAKLLIIDVKSEANNTIKLVESGAVITFDQTAVSTMLKNVTEKSEIVTQDGKKVADDAVIATGMKIVIKDNSGKVVDEKLIVVPGDVDCDGSVSASDARASLRKAVGLDTLKDYQENASDVDRDTKITASDAREILRASVGLTDKKDFYNKAK